MQWVTRLAEGEIIVDTAGRGGIWQSGRACRTCRWKSVSLKAGTTWITPHAGTGFVHMTWEMGTKIDLLTKAGLLVDGGREP